jgi:glycosyltransferase involved in cell wall biosynthesis
MTRNTPTYSLVIPVYNEAKVIERVVREYHEKLTSKLNSCEFIIAEDGSTDGTKEILARLSKEIPCRLVTGAARKGYTRAVLDALRLAGTDFVLFSDSGGGHDPADFFKMLPFTERYAIVSGYKAPRRDPFSRIVYSKVFNAYISVLFLHWFRDIDSGFKIYKRDVLDSVLPQCRLFRECVSSEIILRAIVQGHRLKEVPITHLKRDLEEVKTFKLAKLPKIVFGLLRSVLVLRLTARKVAAS